MCAHSAETPKTMTVAEFIAKLQGMPQNAVVKVYEYDGDFFDPVAELEIASNGTAVHIIGAYSKAMY